MEPLSRKILYRKEEKAKGPPKNPEPVKAPPNKKQDLVEWLAAHPLINVSGLAATCGIDRGNLTRFIKAGVIPEKHRGKIEEALRDYGY